LALSEEGAIGTPFLGEDSLVALLLAQTSNISLFISDSQETPRAHQHSGYSQLSHPPVKTGDRVEIYLLLDIE
jgi:hypothetical protein